MMNPIDFGGQRSKVKVTIDIYVHKLVNTKKTVVMLSLFIKLGRHVNHGERMNSIDFGGHRSKVKVIKGITDKCGVRGMLGFALFYFKSVLSVSNLVNNTDCTFSPITFKLYMYLSCAWREEEPYWFWVIGSKVNVNFVTLCMKTRGHDTDYSFSQITFKLHM